MVNKRTIYFPLYKKILSYLYPLKIEESNKPHYLELLLSKNKLILNSQNANQSNENLERAFHLVFHELNMYPRQFEKVLILGFGLGSAANLLKNNVKEVIAVENDSRVIQWYYDYSDSSSIQFVHQSAEILGFENQSFDLIIVDLFIDTEIPNFLNSLSYWQHLISLLNSKGLLIWNTLIEHSPKTDFEIEHFFSKKIEVIGLNRMWVIEN